MPTTATRIPANFRLVFGKALCPPVHETWTERDEDGHRSIPCEQDHYPEVDALGEAEEVATLDYRTALLVAKATIENADRVFPEVPLVDLVVRGNIGQTDAQSFVAFGWMGLAETLVLIDQVLARQ